MKTIALFLSLSLLPGLAQQQQKKEETAPKPANTVRVFQLRHHNGESIVQTLRSLDVRVTFDPRLNLLAVSAPASAMAGVADVVQKLDQPAPAPKNVEITAYILLASSQAAQETLPADLEPVAKQLRATFGFQSFRVLDAPLVRGREGDRARIIGTLTIAPAEAPEYSLTFAPSIIGNTTIRLENLSFSSNQVPVGIGTQVDIAAGQKVVVGKAGIKGKGQEQDRSMILVLSGRIID